MLQRTSATDTEGSTTWLYALRRRRQHLQQFRLVEIPASLAASKQHLLTLECAGDKNFLARNRGDAFSIVGYRVDSGRFRLAH